MPQQEAALKADALRALEIRERLRAVPRYLAPKQVGVVKKALKVCEERLDKLEVDGLVVKCEALSDPAKRAFLGRIGVLGKS